MSPDRTGVAAFTAGASLVRPDTVVVSDVGRDRPGDGLGMDGVHGLGRAARVARGVSAADRAGTGAGLVQPDPWSGAELGAGKSEEHTSELQSLMRISYAVFCLKK